MESEAAIISAMLASRKAWDVVVQLNASTDLSPHGMELFKFTSSYYEADSGAESVDIDLLLGTISNRKPLSYEKLEAVINNLPEASPSNLINILTEQRLKRLGADMTAAFAGGNHEQAARLSAEYHEVYEMGVESSDEDNELYEVYQGVSVNKLTQTLREGANYSLLPSLLGDIVFNMMKGDHVIVYGDVNVGKSAVVIQIACDYAYDDMIVLYVGNEDPADRMVLRMVCNLVEQPLQTVKDDNEDDYWTDEAKSAGYDNIIFKELAGGTVGEIRKLCEKFKPDICIVDQARNLAADPRKGAFECNQAEVFYQLRMLWKELKIVGVSVTQASTTDLNGKAINKKIKLAQEDIFGSRKEVPAQGDVMIGIGATEAMKQNGSLYLNVSKNKATGIHDGVMCVIDPFTSSVKGD